MKEKHIQVTKTARYFTLGEISAETRRIWIVLHGYAQLAKDFISPFLTLDLNENFIIAPEGLNRFYAKGFAGKPAATWMTSEDRLNEIRDYIDYIDAVYAAVIPPNTKAKIILLGFSQGVATASRWLCANKYRVDHFVIYAGEMGTELLNPLNEKLKSTPLTYVTGKEDPMITRESHTKVYELMKGLNAAIVEFDGGHEMKEEAIRRIVI